MVLLGGGVIKGQLFVFHFQNEHQMIPLHPLQWSVGHPTYWWPSWQPPCLYRSWWGRRGRSWSHTPSARPQTHWNEGSNEEGKKEKSPLWLIARYSSQQQLPDSTLTPQPHTHCKQRLSVISKLETPSVPHPSYCSSCAAGVIKCVWPGVKLRKRGSLMAKKQHKCTENNPRVRGARFMWDCMLVRPCPANSIQIQSFTLLWILEHNRVQ